MDALDLKILKILEKNGRAEVEDISAITGLSEDVVAAHIAAMEKSGIIRGYKTVIAWDKVDPDRVSAVIELKVTPKAGFGFEEVAERIAKYPEVESVSLMSGAYDLNVVVKGKTFHEVTNFVSRQLATIDSVTGTATQFVMRRYKEFDVDLISTEEDGRGKIFL
jgi:DNA-binding Lrp family transcriptional regulator